MLYDLAEARLRACQDEGAPKAHLINLFAEEVTRQDVVDALDQMHQPRDAFKFLYRCLTEHCSNVTAEDNEWKVPRLVLEMVRKQEAERLQQLYRGIRPA
jgi:benzoyl-CoA reductase/2-hydroxyglutaryl-CoA dehydratase subunit BcrC/BadD/HgdB